MSPSSLPTTPPSLPVCTKSSPPFHIQKPGKIGYVTFRPCSPKRKEKLAISFKEVSLKMRCCQCSGASASVSAEGERHKREKERRKKKPAKNHERTQRFPAVCCSCCRNKNKNNEHDICNSSVFIPISNAFPCHILSESCPTPSHNLALAYQLSTELGAVQRQVNVEVDPIEGALWCVHTLEVLFQVLARQIRCERDNLLDSCSSQLAPILAKYLNSWKNVLGSLVYSGHTSSSHA